ncbi:response regulator transcription factor [Ruegeria arenilitoris]|uniref:response regulator transcription factor n=1 Tax=Ruegeria arenilitoris TaxID=1173585 RepID=UPI00147CF7F9|nr:response regulator transcription factor [Ruegeria arenilitoris]
MKKLNVLLVEDDPSLLALTSALLRPHFSVLQASNVAEARAVLASKPVDIALLDLGLPDEDGLVLARSMRAKSAHPPIIFVSSRDSASDKISGLDIGGDDYLTKPFDPDELLSRINAVLRRTNAHASAPRRETRVRLGEVEIDLDTRQVWNERLETTPFTRAEFDVLMAIVNANGRVLSRAVLLDAVALSPDHDAGERTIDALVAKIRKKLSSGQDGPKIISTVHGVGYRLGLVRS